jgi:putative ABC transport system substrate-binding protein
MKRREFITLLGGAAVAWPLAARAQQGAKMPRIGIVDDTPMWQTFRQALRELGYIEGETVNYEYRYSEGAPDRLATVVGELIRRPVDLIAWAQGRRRRGDKGYARRAQRCRHSAATAASP